MGNNQQKNLKNKILDRIIYVLVVFVILLIGILAGLKISEYTKKNNETKVEENNKEAEIEEKYNKAIKLDRCQ